MTDQRQARNPDAPQGVIVFVLNTLAVGGMERMVLAMARALGQRARFAPAIACLADPGPLAEQARADGVPVVSNLLNHKFDFAALGRLRRLFAGAGLPGPAAAVVIVNPGGDRMFWTALARGRPGLAPPLILWTQRTPLPGRPVIERVNRLLSGRLDAIAVLGPRQAKVYATLENLPADRMHVVSNGLSLERIEQLSSESNAQSRAAVRGQFGVADNERVVLCVANIRPIKRVDLFCKVADMLRDRRLRFWLAGATPNLRARKMMSELLAEFDLAPPRFEWLGGRDDIDRLLPAADIGVCCSDSEGLSVSMLEAMAAGVAFVSTAVGEHPGVIEHEHNGLLVDRGDAQGLAQAIDRLAGDDQLRARVASAARQAVCERYTIERSAEAMESLVQTLCAGSRNS